MEDWEVVTDPLMLLGKAGIQELEGTQLNEAGIQEVELTETQLGKAGLQETGSDEDVAGVEVDGCCGANESLQG